MRRLSIRAGAWMMLAGLAALGLFALSLTGVVQSQREAIVQNRFEQLKINADVIGDHVEELVRAYGDWNEYDYVRDYAPMLQRMDAWRGTYAAMFDEHGERLSNREILEGETALDPWLDARFAGAVRENNSGEALAAAELPGGEVSDRRVYYRWIPMGEYEHKLLLVVSLDPSALSIDPSEKLIGWCVGLLITAMLAVTVSIIALIHHKHDIIPEEERSVCGKAEGAIGCLATPNC
jgi:hypothetical protein